MCNVSTVVQTVRDLRRRWKPHKERLAALGGEQPRPSVFTGRAVGWPASRQMPEGQDHDLGLVSLWIAFNSLYGQWDCQKREPKPDRESWRGVHRPDSQARLRWLCRRCPTRAQAAGHLPAGRRVPEQLLLAGAIRFRAKQSRKAAYNAQTWYIEKRWTMVLDEILNRVYVMRCQLVHGAATYGGKLNRASLKRCVMMMQRLLPAFWWFGLTTAPTKTGGRCAIRR